MARGSIDYEQLSVYLKVLGVANRLQLLRKLQVPHTAGEVALPASRLGSGGHATLKISRQAVEGHLQQLAALGLIQARKGTRDGRKVTEYMLDHGRLFVVADELRRLGLLRPSVPLATATPSTSVSGRNDPIVPLGPTFVLATGPMEGTMFPLGGHGPWIIGRQPTLPVGLPYDPFVSRENTQIQRRDGQLFISTLPGARNGTHLNWRVLAAGESAALAAGDAVGVGRSLLFLRGI
ncbi:MAG TPA: hypothetical protein VGB18_07635 [Candidatus Thermoplasmatota archaeon]